MNNNKKSPVIDLEKEEYLVARDLNLRATTASYEAHKDADYVIVCTPTNYDSDNNYFNIRTVEAVIANVLSIKPVTVMVIKSTVPVGYTKKLVRFSILKTLYSHLSS